MNAFSNSADAGEGTPRLAEAPISLLKGRLLVRMPQGARIEARQRSIMAAPESVEEETRVVYDAGPKRFVLLARETFSTADSNFHRQLDKTVAGWGQPPEISYATDRLLKDGKFEVTQIFPSRLDTAQEAVFLRMVYALLPDTTLIEISVYANPAAAGDCEAAVGLAETILKSLAPGKTDLRLDGGRRLLDADTNDRVLDISVPPGVVLTTQEGPDFRVYRFRKVVPFGKTTPTLGIYLGGHPGYQHARWDKSTVTITKVEGTVLGEQVEWFDVRPKDSPGSDPTLLMETILPAKPVERRLYYHIFLTSEDDQGIQALLPIAKSLRLDFKNTSVD